jgi:glycosyltransferase involved in cell wall biosynthesis
MSIQKQKNEMLSTIIVINKKHMQKNIHEGFRVGATSFSINIKKHLENNQSYIGTVFYERDESISSPLLLVEHDNQRYSLSLRFNFRMPPQIIAQSLKDAFNILQKLDKNKSSGYIVYYQTDTFLSFHPNGVPYCVTHHGPFIEHFLKKYSYEEAGYAFGGKDKVDHLLTQQKKGISVLKDGSGFAILHSLIQKNFLLERNIMHSQCLKITPPIKLPSHYNDDNINSETIANFIETLTKQDIILITAVARLDYFKNIEMFLEASIHVTKNTTNIKVLIMGDDPDVKVNRNKLRNLIPSALNDRFLIHSKISPNDLNVVFNKLSNKGIFVCTSRYETLGITPLEAAITGLYTLMPDLDSVEASFYFKEKDLFYYETEKLSAKIFEVINSKSYKNNIQKDYITDCFSEEKFAQSTENAWSQMANILKKNENAY